MDQWIKFSLEEENIIVDKRTSFSQKSETVVQVILTIAEYRQIFFSKSQINALQEVLQKKKPSVFWNFSEIDIIYTMASFRKINEWLEHDRFREAHKSNTNERTPVDREKEFIQHSEVVLRNVKLDLEAEKIYFSTNKIDGCSYPYVIDPNNFSIFKLQEQNDDADRIYRNKYFLTLLNTFDCKCARCGVKDKGIHLDHFMIPRSSGGTFCVQTKTGFKIHNALPLCETCNTSKGDRSYRKFFKDEELISIFGKILTLPKLN